LCREEAFDLAEAAPLALDQAGKGLGKEKSAANGHGNQGMKRFEEIWLS
jgi:hypothetical protein